ncbi:unnamed protein product, partial [Allacma fusca]
YLADQILNPDSEIKRLVEIYLLDFYETSGFADFKHVLSTSNVIVSQNPICGYRLIRRVKFFLSHLVSRIVFFRTFGELARKIFFFFWENGWPSGNDQIEATNGIFKILEAHDFDVDQFANVEKVAEDRKTSVPFLKFWLRKSINKHNLDFDEETMMDFGDAWFDRKIQDFSGDGRRARKLRTLHRETLKRTRKLTGEYIDYWAICTGENFQTESEKTSMTAWSTEAEARGISRRIERIVGMHVVGESLAESLQVASYTFAGYFDPHNDEEGDGPYRSLRIATFMFYMERRTSPHCMDHARYYWEKNGSQQNGSCLMFSIILYIIPRGFVSVMQKIMPNICAE